MNPYRCHDFIVSLFRIKLRSPCSTEKSSTRVDRKSNSSKYKLIVISQVSNGKKSFMLFDNLVRKAAMLVWHSMFIILTTGERERMGNFWKTFLLPGIVTCSFLGFVATFIASWMRKKIEEMARINLLMCFHLCVCV